MGDATRGTKVGVGINNNGVKKVEIEVPAEVEIRKGRTGRTILKTETGKSQAL
jgi:hypothetical protein